ncbi:MAG: YggS family pyridoxal phosphate-dependent enzyme [Chloroflexi bacterium]|nr:YggS family pyridoxal phosphate-dependent enzyme [Chloroflexota bacterium]
MHSLSHRSLLFPSGRARTYRTFWDHHRPQGSRRVSQIATNLEAVYRRLYRAAERAGRSADEITLITVTKTHPLETVVQAYQAGLRHFGENRATEGRDKAAGLADWLARTGGEPPTWHLIGHLQSRQADEALGVFHVIHSLDSLKLAQRIQRLAERDNYPPVEVLLQCNVSGEASKSGFELARWSSDQSQLEMFLEAAAHIGSLDKIIIRGLMTMAPWFDNPELAHPTFQSLAALRARLRAELPQFDWTHLSMGMTDDFEVAIEEGATMVRVGRAIFGERGSGSKK